MGEKAVAFTKVLRDHVSEQLGAIARPDDIRFADNLPKTRSGKILRRLLRAIARNEDITQDLSTLENPAIIDQLRGDEATPATKPAVNATKAKTVAPARRKKAPLKKAAAAKKAAGTASRKRATRKIPPRKKPGMVTRGFLGKLAKKAGKILKKPAKASKSGPKKSGPAKKKRVAARKK
jgi:hypothetical protein